MVIDSKEYVQEVKRFLSATRYLRMQLLRRRPFYGYALTALKDPVVAPQIESLCTDGLHIRFNPAFTAGLTLPQINFVLLHELSHILLLHCTRIGMRDMTLWNIAGDYIINYELLQMIPELRMDDVQLEMPAGGLLLRDSTGNLVVLDNVSTEALYDQLQKQGGIGFAGQNHLDEDGQGSPNGSSGNGQGSLNGSNEDKQNSLNGSNEDKQNSPNGSSGDGQDDPGCTGGREECHAPGIFNAKDLTAGIGDSVHKVEEAIQDIIRDAISIDHENGCGSGKSHMIQRVISVLKVKKINWKSYLRRFFTEAIGDDCSYLTPERKYLPFDIILPGPGREERLDDLWVFIDSSGSIGDEELEMFLGQAYVIAKDFNCKMAIAFWDTEVHDVFVDMESPEEVARVRPAYSGGTDIDCVLRYIVDNRLQASAFMICTDGCFFHVDAELLKDAGAKHKTILALSRDFPENETMLSTVGKLVSLF